ncbi:MAG: hypothetical protein HON42_00125 [Alphaproteobacteria bacterium]|jgi:F-type H+-transporting ATPase subunit b|nr:hypothetical protein [Alphaproteobacteria bacterium]MBT5827889.1 hypothetical protein [Alphaproteobacteria bacterium]
MFDEKFWIAVAFFIFVALAYKKLSNIFINSLDSKRKEIEDELNKATDLRKEAKKIKDSYLRKQKLVEQEASKIIHNAELASEKMLDEAKLQIEKTTSTKLAQIELHIADIQKQAIDEIKINAVKTAIEKFSKNLDTNIDQEKLIDKNINSLKHSA